MPDDRTAQKGAEMYAKMRDMMLHLSAGQVKRAPDAKPGLSMAALMDLRVPNGTATVVAVADGTVSLYFSSGGGFIGGGGRESVRKAGLQFLSAAEQLLPEMDLTLDYPLPRDGEVKFYVVTASGVLAATVRKDASEGRKEVFAPLYRAGQEVITQYRLMYPNGLGTKPRGKV